MKYLLIIGLSLLLSTGCIMTKMLIPDVDTRMSSSELEHKSTVADKTQTQIAKLLENGELKNDKAKLSAAKLIYKTGADANDIVPSATENIMQQYMRMQGQEVLDSQLNAGFEWTTRTIGEIAGGATGGIGITGLLLAWLRKKKVLGVVNATVSPEEKAKVKRELSYTNLERQIT